MRTIVFTIGCCLAFPAFAQAERVTRGAQDGWVDAGGGCKVAVSPRQGGRIRWVGPCEDGLAHGEGYFAHDDKQGKERSIGRMTMERGSSVVHPGQSSHTLYVLYDGTFRKIVADGKRQESVQVSPADLPAYARAFLMEGKLPARPRQSQETVAAAKESSDAKLKTEVERTRITAGGGASSADWIPIGPSYEIDAASLWAVSGRNGVLAVYERGKGSSQVRRLYVTCDPFTWGENQYGMRPVDHSIDYQVDLAREVCRRATLAAKGPRQFVPAYLNPSYETLGEQGQHAEAFAAATKAAESGDARAMNYVGWSLQNGRGTAKNPDAAIPWLQRSAGLGNSSAMINLAWAYQGGHGVPQDLNSALDYANQAKSRNHHQADGYVSSIRSQMARQQAAAEQEARDAAQARAEIEQRRREDEEDERQARREARAEQEARDRQWTDMATSIMQGAAAMKRQQDEQNARRETERRRIEADNARYRQHRADQDRRWLEQNQRQQQAALERQRVDQERQRVEQARLEEERRRPRKERVNLPKYSGCIRLEWDRDKPQEISRWYTLQNGCAQALKVHWCDRPGCQRSTMAATIPGGGSNRGWVLKKNGLSISVMAACQMDNGGETVYYSDTQNQCWTWVTMR